MRESLETRFEQRVFRAFGRATINDENLLGQRDVGEDARHASAHTSEAIHFALAFFCQTAGREVADFTDIGGARAGKNKLRG